MAAKAAKEARGKQRAMGQTCERGKRQRFPVEDFGEFVVIGIEKQPLYWASGPRKATDYERGHKSKSPFNRKYHPAISVAPTGDHVHG